MLTLCIIYQCGEQHDDQQYRLHRFVERHRGEVQRMALKAAAVPLQKKHERAEEQHRAQLQPAAEYVPCFRAHSEHSAYHFFQLHGHFPLHSSNFIHILPQPAPSGNEHILDGSGWIQCLPEMTYCCTAYIPPPVCTFCRRAAVFIYL